MTPSFSDLRFEGDSLRLRLEHLTLADAAAFRDLVGDVRAWQLLSLDLVAGHQPARLSDFRREVGPVQALADPRATSPGSCARLDQSLVNWLAVIDWIRLLDRPHL